MNNNFITITAVMILSLMVLSFVLSIVIRKQRREVLLAAEADYPRIKKRIVLLTCISVIILIMMVVLSIYLMMYYLNK